MISAVDVITTKRDGGRLTDEQVDWVVAAYTRGDVADEQMAALAMAILLNGMDAGETARWTAAMIASGDRLELPDVGRPLVDKHSTGGVGDKITATGAARAASRHGPRASCRGLGTAVGTLDTGFIPAARPLTLGRVSRSLADVGAGSARRADALPADRSYALRDFTALSSPSR